MIGNLRKITVEPRVYAVFFKNKEDEMILDIQIAHSLDFACEEFFKNNPKSFYYPFLWISYPLKELFRGANAFQEAINALQNDIHHNKKSLSFKDGLKQTEEPLPETPESRKNKLMKIIIDTKDATLFVKNKKIFSSAEKKYITGQIKTNGNSKS